MWCQIEAALNISNVFVVSLEVEYGNKVKIPIFWVLIDALAQISMNLRQFNLTFF